MSYNLQTFYETKLKKKLIDSNNNNNIDINNNANDIINNINNNNNMGVDSGQYLIEDFYKNSTILVTGGTGFLGKVLIEKLLRSCTEINCIYLLLRAKKGLTSDQRHSELIQNPIFDRIREKNPLQLQKLIYVSGDISQPMMGLSEQDVQTLVNTVNIVFHSAATVRFDQELKDAANLNTLGSQRLFHLCTQMKQLKSIIHVSTAFCNPKRKDVEEIVYPPKLRFDIETFMKCVNTLPSEIVSQIADSLQGSHPNTYTLTKSIAEQIASAYHHQLPICIVRPSIVTAAIAEPVPGWVDNINGITGIMMEIGRGTISSIMCDENLVMDLIPVDIVCNMMIAAAWHNYFKPSNSIRVYNCTSGQINPVIWKNYGQMTLKYALEYPSKYVMLYPNFTYRTNRCVHRFFEIFYHFLPAICYDTILKFKHKGFKPIFYKIAKRYKAAADTGEYFAMHEWNFETTNVRELIEEVKTVQDGNNYKLDISKMDWDEYIKNYMFGIRKYVLKDDIDSLPTAKKTLQRLYIGKCILQLLFLWFIYAIFSRVLRNAI